MSEENQYSVYMLFTRDEKSLESLQDYFSSKENLLHIRKASLDNKRFVVLMKKSFFENLMNRENFGKNLEYNLTKFRVDQNPLEKLKN